MDGPDLLSDDAAIQRAVEAAGWTFVRFGGRGMIVEGREFDVIHFSACRGGLGAWVTVLRGDSASDAFVERVELGPTVVSAARGAVALKVGVEVLDGQCAVEELKRLTTDPRPQGFFAYVAAISEHGWTVDREHMREDDYDFTWHIPARRGEDQLVLHVSFFGPRNEDQPVHIGDSGGAWMIESGISWTLHVRVPALARELADALLRPRTSP